jgi:membrane-associated HD superfamily phosphohydrolase
MEFIFGIIGIVVIISFLKSFFSSTFSNFKILTGVQGQEQLQNTDAYRLLAMCVDGVFLLVTAFSITAYISTELGRSRISLLLFISIILILTFIVIAVSWVVGVIVIYRFSSDERKIIYPDLLQKGRLGQLARFQIGQVFIVHLLTVLGVFVGIMWLLYSVVTEK